MNFNMDSVLINTPLVHKDKNNLQVMWKGVTYTSGISGIKKQLIDIANNQTKSIDNIRLSDISSIYGSITFPMDSSISRVRTGVSGSGKFHSHDLTRQNSSESEMESVDSGSEKRTLKKNQVRLNRRNRVSPTFSQLAVNINLLRRSPSTTVGDLQMVFSQNKPNNFIGIRKVKTYDYAENRDEKRKSLSLFDEYALKALLHESDSIRYTSIHAQRFSISRPVKKNHDIHERLSQLSRHDSYSQKLSIKKEFLEILKKLASQKTSDKMNLMKILAFQKQLDISDFDDKLTRKRLLELLVEKYYRADHPKRCEYTENFPETDWEKKLMENCVLKNNYLKSIVNQKSFYTLKQQIKMADIDAELTLADHEDDILVKPDNKQNIKMNFECKSIDELIEKRLLKQPTSILEEISKQSQQFSGFYRPLLHVWDSYVAINKYLCMENDVEQIKKCIKSITKILADNKNNPFSDARILIQQFIKSSEVNSVLFQEMTASFDSWLDQVLKTLLSTYESIRFEAFLTIAFMFSKSSYVSALYNNILNEALYDIIATIIRCIDVQVNDFEMYFSLLCVIFHHASSQTIIECIVERAPYSIHVEMVSQWCKLIYLAMKYWPSDNFNHNSLYLKRFIETLENHYVREKLCRKTVKEAISCICKRFKLTSNVITFWPNHEENFPK